MNLEETVKSAVIRAKEILKKDKYHNPIVIGFKNNKRFVLPIISWNSCKQKEQIFKNIVNTLKKLEADVFVYIKKLKGT